MIEPVLPLLASLPAIAPVAPTPSPPDFGSIVQHLASVFSSGTLQLLLAMDGTVIDVTRVAYFTVLLVGVFVYFARINRRLGRELMIGGMALAILSEFVFPAVVTV
jgi:hypothetical protein